ncbi:hypothetical protein TNCV_2030741 [Trichonephila clavipes]|nr:hypothetical protein TNCV_2030741 [Trichonephila clavipes]
MQDIIIRSVIPYDLVPSILVFKFFQLTESLEGVFVEPLELESSFVETPRTRRCFRGTPKTKLEGVFVEPIELESSFAEPLEIEGVFVEPIELESSFVEPYSTHTLRKTYLKIIFKVDQHVIGTLYEDH